MWRRDAGGHRHAGPGNALTRSVGGGNQARPRRYQLLLGALAVGDVAHVGGEDRLSGQASARDSQLSRKFSAVGAHGRACQSGGPGCCSARSPGSGRGHAGGAAATGARPHRPGLGRSRPRPGSPEGALECAVHVRHPGAPVNADDRVESSFENGALPGRAHGEHGRRVSATSRLRSAWPRSSASETLCSRASSALRTVAACSRAARSVSVGGASGIHEGDDAQDIGLRHGRHQPGTPVVDRTAGGSQQAYDLLLDAPASGSTRR